MLVILSAARSAAVEGQAHAEIRLPFNYAPPALLRMTDL